jgi:hypothetical protein
MNTNTNTRIRPPPIVIIKNPKNITPIRKPEPRPKNITPIRKPETYNVKHRPITPKYVKPCTPKHVVSPIHLYVISDAGKLVQPHSPLGPPPPLKSKFKRPVCKNPYK